MMNTRILVTFLFASLLVTACGDDDAPGGDSLLGTWNTVDFSSETLDYGFVGTSETNVYYVAGQSDITFNGDGTFSRTGEITIQTTGLIAGDTVLSGESTTDLTSAGTYTAENGKLQFDNSGVLSLLYDYNIDGNKLIFQSNQDTAAYIPSIDSTLNLYSRVYNELEKS